MLHHQPGRFANSVLDALPEDSVDTLAPHLQLIRIKCGPLDCVGEPTRHLYFPTTSMMSVLQLMEDGGMVEVAMVGREGIIGLSTLVGGGAIPSRVKVHVGGMAYRMPSSVLRSEFERSRATYRLLLNYCQAVMAQISHSALCNRHHSVREQLARWLLLAHDRIDGDELAVTQQTVANMLGVRREGVTMAACDLQEAGLIRLRRGRITVLDRDGLEERTCECYGRISSAFDGLLNLRERPNTMLVSTCVSEDRRPFLPRGA
ncbi:Crp/Fnr family transcriptional regulator [Burkholderia ubonensis]|uniref:Crp/Fnr family transcriptional regulator n=1 Tax=Burkholderia ubonensis TaxID=101571 RepID=UPI0009B4AFAB|nr:Crp/Fnr family transcriptional regulator [Burkholderia ubonensis]